MEPLWYLVGARIPQEHPGTVRAPKGHWIAVRRCWSTSFNNLSLLSHSPVLVVYTKPLGDILFPLMLDAYPSGMRQTRGRVCGPPSIQKATEPSKGLKLGRKAPFVWNHGASVLRIMPAPSIEYGALASPTGREWLECCSAYYRQVS
jgi:hypothetical protein